MVSAPQPPSLVWLFHAVKELNTTRELNALADVVAHTFQKLALSERTVVLLAEHGKLHQACAYSTHPASVTGIDFKTPSFVQRVYTENQPIVVDHTLTDAPHKRSMQSVKAKALVCLPIQAGGEVLGVLYADSASQKHPGFSPEHLTAFPLFAEAAAVAFDNARRFARASNDPLTGLPNANCFLDQLEHALARSTPTTPGGVLLLDLDHFKRVNQQAGAEMGDKALVDVATTLQEILRADGLVARYGSDKFAVLLPPEDDGLPVGLRLRDAAERARASVATKNYYSVHITACIGGVSFPHPSATSAADLIALADDTLAQARARGTGQVNIA